MRGIHQPFGACLLPVRNVTQNIFIKMSKIYLQIFCADTQNSTTITTRMRKRREYKKKMPSKWKWKMLAKW